MSEPDRFADLRRFLDSLREANGVSLRMAAERMPRDQMLESDEEAGCVIVRV